MIRPTPRALYVGATLSGIAAVIATVAPGLWSIGVVLLLVFLVTLVGDAVFADRREDFRLDLAWPKELSAGDENQVPFTLRRRTSARSPRLDLLPVFEYPPATTAVSEANFGATTTARGSLRFSLSRRGPAKIQGVQATWRGPLGLIERSTYLEGSEATRPVIASLAPIREAALQWSAHRALLEGAKLQRMIGDGREFDALREYQQGHDHRAIDWRTSARMRKLHVREYRDEKNHQVVIALDCGRQMAAVSDGAPRVDQTISCGLVLSYVSLEAGDRVMLYAFDRVPRVQSPTVNRIHQMGMLATVSSSVPYSQEETNWHASFTALEQRLKRRSIVVIYTNLDDPIHAEALSKALPFLTRRHLVIVASLVDDALSSLSSSSLESLDAVQQSVLLDELRRERELSMQTLRARGVRVVEGDRQTLSRLVLQQYGEVKRRGLI